MKKLLSILLFVAISFSLSTNVMAQKKDKKKKSFSGTITYEVKYTGDDLQPAMLAQLPKEVTVKVSGNKKKTEVIAGPMVQTVILDGDNKTMLVLFDAMGMKKYIKVTEEDMKKAADEEKEPIIQTEDETKTICGYTAKKAIVTTVDEFGDSTSTILWYSPELGSRALNFDGQYSDIDGMPLEYEVSSNGMIMHYLAKEVKKSKIKDIEFSLPTGYEEFTQEEKEQMNME